MIGVFLFHQAGQLPAGVLLFALDPGFFPRIIAVTLVALGGILLQQGIKKKVQHTEEPIQKETALRLACVAGLLIAYTLLWGKGFFPLNTFFFLFACHLAMKAKPLLAAISSVVLSVATYYLFTQIFRVRLF